MQVPPSTSSNLAHIYKYTHRNESSETTGPVLANYPKGNFGGNQLLGGSMSLSPLLATKGGNDLHVSSAHNASFHQNFF